MADLFDVSGKTAVVTGGSRGIGLMIARGLATAGVRVIISSRKVRTSRTRRRRFKQLGECEAIPADLVDSGGRAGARGRGRRARTAWRSSSTTRASTWGAPLDEFPASGWDRVMHTNVEGCFYLTVGLLPALRAAASEEDPARVINIGSIDGLRVPITPNFSYSAAKAGVHMLTRHMAKELAPDNITVNAIAPERSRAR